MFDGAGKIRASVIDIAGLGRAVWMSAVCIDSMRDVLLELSLQVEKYG